MACTYIPCLAFTESKSLSMLEQNWDEIRDLRGDNGTESKKDAQFGNRSYLSSCEALVQVTYACTEDKCAQYSHFGDKWAVDEGELTNRFQQTSCKISIHPSKVYKSGDKANDAILLQCSFYKERQPLTRELPALYEGSLHWISLKSAFWMRLVIHVCQSHLWFMKETTLCYSLNLRLGFLTIDSSKTDESWDFLSLLRGRGVGLHSLLLLLEMKKETQDFLTAWSFCKQSIPTSFPELEIHSDGACNISCGQHIFRISLSANVSFQLLLFTGC